MLNGSPASLLRVPLRLTFDDSSACRDEFNVPLATIEDSLRKRAIRSVALMKIDLEAAEMDVLAEVADSPTKGGI